MNRNIISTDDLTDDDIERILACADALRPVAAGQVRIAPLQGAVLANLFFEPSTRSRISFGSAFCRLGGSVLDTTGEAVSSIAKGESVADTARVVSGYADCIVVRHSSNEAVREFATRATVPVISAGAGSDEHPTQALTDLFSLRRELKGRGLEVANANIAILGDLRYGRAAHSFLKILTRFPGCNVRLSSPVSRSMPKDLVDAATFAGLKVTVARNIEEALEGADVVYATRYQVERYPLDEEALAQAARLKVHRSLFSDGCHPIILHPLPRDKVFGELSSDLDGESNLAIFRQTDGGVPVRMGLFLSLFGLSIDEVVANYQPIAWRNQKNS